MNQQINLYQPVFRSQKKVFSALAIMQFVAVLTVGLLVIYGFGRYQLASLERQVAGLERQRDAAAAQLAQVTRDRPAVQRSALLDEQLQQAQRELMQKRQLIRVLEQRGITGNVTGYSEHFSGLGRQRVHGVWLTRIAVRDTGEVRLEGFSEQAHLVPRYLQRLSNEQAFRGTEFHSVRIVRDQGERIVSFRVSTVPGGEL